MLGYAAWLLMTIVLVLRLVIGWRGRQPAWVTLTGTLCILVVVALYAVQAGLGVGL
jgi:ABC-type uncharacterized transport system permease subunit